MTRAEALLRLAREAARRPDPSLRGISPRAAAILGRQAIEADLLERGLGGSTGASVSLRAQLICLHDQVPGTLAGEARYAWWALTRACHHHPYDLPPTAVELDDLLGTVGRLLEARRPVPYVVEAGRTADSPRL